MSLPAGACQFKTLGAVAEATGRHCAGGTMAHKALGRDSLYNTYIPAPSRRATVAGLGGLKALFSAEPPSVWAGDESDRAAG
eukprot:5147513-Pleurochrysis_carterae.AAC.1